MVVLGVDLGDLGHDQTSSRCSTAPLAASPAFAALERAQHDRETSRAATREGPSNSINATAGWPLRRPADASPAHRTPTDGGGAEPCPLREPSGRVRGNQTAMD